MQFPSLSSKHVVKTKMLSLGGVVLCVTLCAGFFQCAPEQRTEHADVLAKSFPNPPAEDRPWVYWYWINGTMTREGIHADLESMARVGIGGVLILEVDHSTPGGPVKFLSPEWVELFTYACSEADRLGMKVRVNNDAGWTGSGGPWITPELSMQKVVWSETRLHGPRRFRDLLLQPKGYQNCYRDIVVLAIPEPEDDKYRIGDIGWKAGFEARSVVNTFPRYPAVLPSLPASQVAGKQQVLDLTAKFHDGLLDWEAPPGKWLVLRFGFTSTGKGNHPAPKSGEGLECDRLNSDAMDLHFNSLVRKLIDAVGPLAGKTLVATHIDSWESQAQNWTANLPEEFRKRRGYDLLPFLPVMTGRVIESLEISERFLWDLRLTLGELANEKYIQRLRDLANERGLRLSMEPYDWDFLDDMAAAGCVDEPQAEFWYGPDPEPQKYRSYAWCAGIASAAHTYGKRIVAAESFTSMPWERWQGHPASIKKVGDWAFCEGINRMIFHTFTMQPWADPNIAPGQGMGFWGLHYERTQTWWEQSKPWHEYLTRCQYMLRQGLFVADLCYMQPEGAPMRFQPPVISVTAEAPDRPGYNYDGCTPEVVMTRMKVKDGRLVLPDGMSYRALVLPEHGSVMPGAEMMTPQLLTKIVQLVESGATVIGERPLRSPSLSGYPGCDAEVQELADHLWGETRESVGERKVGKGRVIWGKTPAEVLAGMGVVSDFSCKESPAPVRYTHRKLDDGTDVYFVANKSDTIARTTCLFRVTGKEPEFWWPESGRMEVVGDWQTVDTRTSLPLQLDPSGSVFVVFRKRSDRAQGLKNWLEFKPVQEIAGPWKVRFESNRGGPEKPVLFDNLDDWSKRPEKGIKYYSGAAVYSKTFEYQSARGTQEPLFLDLGKVAVMAEVKLNGRDLGIAWKQPFRLEIGDAIRNGENELEVKVVNLWCNRLIGDEQLPQDCVWDENYAGWRLPGSGVPLLKWPTWLTEKKARTSGRIGFTTWKLFTRTDRLLESGLLGPVSLQTATRHNVATAD
jgi:hypothetical protein